MQRSRLRPFGRWGCELQDDEDREKTGDFLGFSMVFQEFFLFRKRKGPKQPTHPTDQPKTFKNSKKTIKQHQKAPKKHQKDLLKRPPKKHQNTESKTKKNIPKHHPTPKKNKEKPKQKEAQPGRYFYQRFAKCLVLYQLSLLGSWLVRSKARWVDFLALQTWQVGR